MYTLYLGIYLNPLGRTKKEREQRERERERERLAMLLKTRGHIG